MSIVPQWMAALPQLLIVAGLTVVFAAWAWGARAITGAAAITGIIITLVLCAAAGPGALVAISVVFLLTHLSTRTGRRRKERLGSMEKREGRGPYSCWPTWEPLPCAPRRCCLLTTRTGCFWPPPAPRWPRPPETPSAANWGRYLDAAPG